MPLSCYIRRDMDPEGGTISSAVGHDKYQSTAHTHTHIHTHTHPHPHPTHIHGKISAAPIMCHDLCKVRDCFCGREVRHVWQRCHGPDCGTHTKEVVTTWMCMNCFAEEIEDEEDKGGDSGYEGDEMSLDAEGDGGENGDDDADAGFLDSLATPPSSSLASSSSSSVGSPAAFHPAQPNPNTPAVVVVVDDGPELIFPFAPSPEQFEPQQ